MIFMNKASLHLRRMLVSAVLLAVALVLKTFFSVYIPLLGQNGMSVGISGIFSMLPSVLFGPFYGAAVSGLSDLLGYVLKPSGAYMPLLTLNAALGGFLRGWLFFRMRGKKDKHLRAAVIAVTVLLLLAGIFGLVCLQADGVDGTFYDRVTPEEALAMEGLSPVSRLLITRTANTKDPGGNLAGYLVSVTYGPLACAAFGALILAADWFTARRLLEGRKKVNVLALVLAVSLSGMVITTVNTIVLRETIYASWKVLPFAVVWVPRAIEELLAGVVKVCFMAILLGVCAGQPALRKLTDLN